MAFPKWAASGNAARIGDCGDSHLIRDGNTVARTIHCTVQSARTRQR